MYSGIFHNYYVSISFSMLTAILYTDTMTHHCVPDPTEMISALGTGQPSMWENTHQCFRSFLCLYLCPLKSTICNVHKS